MILGQPLGSLSISRTMNDRMNYLSHFAFRTFILLLNFYKMGGAFIYVNGMVRQERTEECRQREMGPKL